MAMTTSPGPQDSTFKKIVGITKSIFSWLARLIDIQWKRYRSKRQTVDAFPHHTSETPLYGEDHQEEEKQRIDLAPEQAVLPSHREPLPPSQLLLPPTEKKHARSRSRSRSRDRRTEPQGLNVIYDPGEDRRADIVFVHGLGGSSISTWTKDGDETKFWPQKFLASEPGLSNTRIFSFGYTAFYLDAKSSSELSITDFARSLLADLKNEPERTLGQVSSPTSACTRLTDLEKVPIIFVAHSLGGLVVKKVFRGDLAPFLS
jgi:hypothetical protein